VHYYETLAQAHEKAHLTLDLVMVHAETSRVFEYAGAGDRDGLARYLRSLSIASRRQEQTWLSSRLSPLTIACGNFSPSRRCRCSIYSNRW